MTEDEIAGWHHRLNGHGFVWAPGVDDGQGGLVCCGSWGHKESDTTPCDPMNRSMPGFLDLHNLLEFAQIHIHRVNDAIYWRRLLRVPWTARRSNQSILKEISPWCSLEGLMLKLKLQYFGHLI